MLAELDGSARTIASPIDGRERAGRCPTIVEEEPTSIGEELLPRSIYVHRRASSSSSGADELDESVLASRT